VTEAYKLLDAMIQKGIEPNIITYSALTDGYGLIGELDKAVELLSSCFQMVLNLVLFLIAYLSTYIVNMGGVVWLLYFSMR